VSSPSHNSALTRLPRVPYGAVYFRKSNPPPEDWARDYSTAAEDGHNVFRHWFLWNAIEVAPGEFDWADYDRQLDLAAEHGLKTIIAEMITAAPEWAWRQYAHARFQDAGRKPAVSQLSGSCATGGFPGLCLDNEDVRASPARSWPHSPRTTAATPLWPATTSGTSATSAVATATAPPRSSAFVTG
jgi:beta-galactosidase